MCVQAAGSHPGAPGRAGDVAPPRRPKPRHCADLRINVSISCRRSIIFSCRSAKAVFPGPLLMNIISQQQTEQRGPEVPTGRQRCVFLFYFLPSHTVPPAGSPSREPRLSARPLLLRTGGFCIARLARHVSISRARKPSCRVPVQREHGPHAFCARDQRQKCTWHF